MTQSPAAVPAAEFDRPTCLALLGGGRLGRLVFSYRALPDVHPAHYRLDGENILIRLAVGSVASRASRDRVVAFAVDEFDVARRTGWGVAAVGLAHELLDPGARIEAMVTQVGSWREDGPTSLFSITAAEISGRRLVALP